ncbi:hypothetical protein J2T10_000764 [Paenarthrobacter nicotinovorans]|jgi:hypothetical protein|uniref:Uncharacterized protein n=1 Tax=Paenarthrobacter nicotinovorans TaxID=29320 RepID=A0ABT9TI78_PAENI|nr:hypothetical protein [Paenarthrobacter nicotinovorans]MDQ0101145.1 hypothetical protein [Paenarthrobacter nicotinovorans]
MAGESYSTLTAARARAEAHLATVQGQLDTARASVQATLRAAFIAGTAVGTTADSASADVARLLATVTATQNVLTELSGQISLANDYPFR